MPQFIRSHINHIYAIKFNAIALINWTIINQMQNNFSLMENTNISDEDDDDDDDNDNADCNDDVGRIFLLCNDQ